MKNLKRAIQQIAQQRIEKLFSEAEKIAKENLMRASRYVEIARKISLHYKIKLPREIKRKFCKKCGVYWIPTKNMRPRIYRRRVILKCLNCGAIKRIPLKCK